MSNICTQKRLDIKNISDGIKKWLIDRKWETKTDKIEGNYYVQAKKSSWWRTGIGADRALKIHIYSNEEGTFVNIGQGDWTANIASNIAWAIATGGTNIAISGWSFILQRQLQNFVQEMFDGANANLQIEDNASPEYKIEMKQTTMEEEEYHTEYRCIDNLHGEGSVKQEVVLVQNWSSSFDINYSESNCFDIEQSNTSKRGFEHYIEQEKGVKAKIEQEVKNYYSIKGEQSQSYSQKTDYEVPPCRKLKIKIKWKRHWQHGVIRVFLADNSRIEIPYKVIVAISHEPAVETTNI